MIPKKIIDNSDVKLSTFLNEVLKEVPNTRFDIATAFFNIQAYSLIKDNIQDVKSFRLLLGKAPEIRSETTLGDVLLKMIREEVEGFELSEDKNSLVKEFIEFLNRENIEVRLYEKEFLHGKAYIFDELVVVGSSNFTPAGLTHNTELNSVSLDSEARYVRANWFDKFWNEALDFKAGLISLLEASRFGTREYTPYEVYIKSLYELQKDDIKYENEGKEEESGRPASKVNLSEFQEDAVKRVFSRLKKYRACMVADSVGLGKTWIAKRIIEEFGFYKRKRFLIVCPAQLRGMWREAVKDLILSESILSQEELDSTILGEEVNPKVFGIIRRIRERDAKVFDELENEVFGGGERFYQPLKDYLRTKAVEELEAIPNGIYSGLERGIRGIFFYYKYGNDFHFWYLYDFIKDERITNKTRIMDFISCSTEERRVIPDFFERVYEINRNIIRDVEESYKEVEQQETVDSVFIELNRDRSKKFIATIIREMGLRMDEYLLDFPEDEEIEKLWEEIKSRLLAISLTKKRIRSLRSLWNNYRNNHKNWKRLLNDLSEFLEGKQAVEREEILPYNPQLLKLIAVDFVC